MPSPAFSAPVAAGIFTHQSQNLSSRASSRPKSPIHPRHVSTLVRAVAEPAARPSESTGSVQDTFSDSVMNTYARFPIAMSHGSGAQLFDLDGNRYIDCVAGIATCTLGHAHPDVIDAVSSQIRKVSHVSNLYYIPQQAALAKWLTDNSPADKVFFCNSGAEANEAAIKLARKRWHVARGSTANAHDVPIIITAESSFHGRTLATLTATGQPKFHENWWPLVDGFEYVRYNDVAHLQQLAKEAGPRLAGIMLEALQGEGGIRPASTEFLRAARDACDAVDAVLICDEVQVGMGRTGSLWGFEASGVQPDVFTLAKGLGGGVPIGAMLATNRCNVFAPGDHASTFGGNPLATAAGLAVAQQLSEGGVLDNARDRGEQLGAALQALADANPDIIAEVRGRGLIRGVQLKGIPAVQVVKCAMACGLLLVPAGASVVRFVPPLIVSSEEINEIVEKFGEALFKTAAS